MTSRVVYTQRGVRRVKENVWRGNVPRYTRDRHRTVGELQVQGQINARRTALSPRVPCRSWPQHQGMCVRLFLPHPEKTCRACGSRLVPSASSACKAPIDSGTSPPPNIVRQSIRRSPPPRRLFNRL